MDCQIIDGVLWACLWHLGHNRLYYPSSNRWWWNCHGKETHSKDFQSNLKWNIEKNNASWVFKFDIVRQLLEMFRMGFFMFNVIRF